jgi:predicted O-linked N-acetylglucosamine transferase (SPINDLY family)
MDTTSGKLRVEQAQALAAAGNLRGATDTYLDAFEAGYKHPLILTNLGAALYAEGRFSESVIAYRLALSRDANFTPAWSNFLLALNCFETSTPSEVADEHRKFGELFDKPSPPIGERRPGKLRLGFVCSSFFSHSVTKFLEPVLRSLDREMFEIVGYQGNTHEDAITRHLASLADRWRVIASDTDAEAIERIRQDGIDVLIDLDGHTGGNRLGIFAAKPARVQLTWLGYPNTTGLRSIDFRITDSIADPAPFADELHTEKLLRLDPPFLVFSPPENSPDVAPSPVLQNGYVTFGIFNQIHKLSDSLVTSASRILDQVPNSRLLLKATAFVDPAVCDATAERFETFGIDRGRITFAGPIRGFNLHLETHHQVDIMLDSFPYTGTTTTCEALWMGVPVVTLEGLTHHARVGSSLLQSIGLPELIGRSVDEYVSTAATLASDTERIASLRNQMRRRMLSSPLMDLPGFTRRFENALLYSDRRAMTPS